MKKPAKSGLTVNGLSDKTGIDRRTIKKRLVAGGKDPRHLHRLAEVIDILRPPEPADGDPKDKTEFERWRKLKLANDRAEQLVIARALVVGIFGTYAVRQKKLLRQKFENELPAAVASIDPGSARVIFKRAIDEVCGLMQEMIGKLEGEGK